MFDLRARLRLDDRMSDPLRRIQRQTEQTQRVLDRINRATDQTSRAMSRAHREVGRLSDGFRLIGKATSSIFSLKNAFIGLTAAIGGVTTAQKLFNSTIGEAAKYEQSSVMIKAMLNDEELGKQYMSLIDRFSVDSPIFNSQDMLGNSKSFLTVSKDMKQLEKMWSLAERMAAIDPIQGLEGAVFALRELFSGDAISMVRRFEMPREIMNDIKNMKLQDQLKALDKYFNKIGLTQKLIDEMGGTTLGIWNQIKEQVAIIMRDMGAPALRTLKKFLDKIRSALGDSAMDGKIFIDGDKKIVFKSNMTKFKEYGAKIMDNVVSGLTSAATRLWGWFDALRNNEEFQKKTTLFGKVDFIFTDISNRFSEWLKNGGQNKLNSNAKKLIEIAAAAFIANQQTIVDAAMAVGKAVGSALVSAAEKSLFEKWENSKLANIWKAEPMKWAAQSGHFIAEKIWGKDDNKTDGKGSGSGGKFTPASHASGLSRVPYNGYQATLHRGERILTPEEAQDYNAGNGRKTVNVSFAGANFNVRQESDIQKIAYELAKLIEREGVRMA